MIPKQAIEKAKSAGWQPPEPCELDGIKFNHYGDTILDPEFWKCLGVALGWGTNTTESQWYYEAFRFYDLMLTGGDTEQFWQTLLDNK